MADAGAGETSNMVSGGILYGPVVQARDFTNTTFITNGRHGSARFTIPFRPVDLAPAVRLAADLAGKPARLLVHTDLHYGDILATKRPGQPWVAIDPRAAVGAPDPHLVGLPPVTRVAAGGRRRQARNNESQPSRSGTTFNTIPVTTPSRTT